MSQNYTINSYHGSHIGNIDLINIETNFECLRSMFSGSSSPANAIIGMPWFHTTDKILKMRNKDNSKWIGIMYGDVDQKLWVYSNSAIDGWTLDSTSPVDCVLALGTDEEGKDYNVNGGNEGGDVNWVQPNKTLSTIHLPAHTHGSKSHSHKTQGGEYGVSSNYIDMPYELTSTTNYVYTSYAGSHTHSSVGGGNPHNHGDTYRPYAAIGTLQHPNI